MKSKDKMLKAKNQSGFSLLETMIAAGILGTLTAYMGQSLNNQFKATKKIEDKIDVSTIRRTIAERLDCKATFEWNSATKAVQACPSPGARLIMKDGANNPITTAKTFKEGRQISGDWYAIARCPEGTENSIVISLAKRAPNDGAGFAKDPLASIKEMSYREIFGPKSTPLCGELFASYVKNNADNCNSSTKPGFVKEVNIDSNPLSKTSHRILSTVRKLSTTRSTGSILLQTPSILRRSSTARS